MSTEKLATNYFIRLQHNYFRGGVSGVLIEADDGKHLQTLYIKVNVIDFAKKTSIELLPRDISAIENHGGDETSIVLRKIRLFFKKTGYSPESTILSSEIDRELLNKILPTP